MPGPGEFSVRRQAAVVAAALHMLFVPLAGLQAQTRADDRLVVYEASFFATFSPTSALQMVERLPGFTLEKTDEEVRGFARAAGNVVINGHRPSSKSETLSTLLARIPAKRVLRIEIAPGERFGSDYSTKPQVANLILAETGGVAGTLEGTVRREYTGAVLPEGGVSALFRSGASSFSLAARLDNNQTTETGYDLVTARPSGALIERRLKTNRIRDPEGKASASWSLEEGDNRSAHLNATFNLGKFRLIQANHVTPVGGTERDDTLFQRYYARTFEAGGDVTRPLAGGGIKLVGLVSRRYRDRNDGSSQFTSTGTALGGYAQRQQDWREESLLRLSWSGKPVDGWTLEAGAEGALNRLESIVDLTETAADGTASRIDLPIDNAIVSETRGEIFANAGHDLSSRLHLDLGLNYEASRLTVEGDVQARRSLQFFKPRATLDWRPGKWHGQLSIQRTVAQLNFEDFISVAELTNDRVNGGNAELLPQRAWEFLLSVDRTILGDGRVKLDIGYEAVSKVADRIPTPEGFDAPGNLGNGTSFSLVGNLDLPMARAGIKGGRLSLYGSYVKTSVRDPYTLAWRPFSGNALFYYNASFRQDLGKFAWGVGFEGSTGNTAYRRNELDKYQGMSPFVTAFAEYRPDRRWTITAGANNVIDAYASRDRDFFLPDRTNPNPFLHEYRYRKSHLVGYLTIKRSFG